jgi:DNA modification methylase
MSEKDVKTDKYQLMFGDCLERMKEIPDGSVDMILTDPPYGMNFQSNWCKDGPRHKKIEDLLKKYDPSLTEYENMLANKWDRIWDCGNAVYGLEF